MEDKYTLVQHSGFGWGDNPQFERAVEERNVDTKAEIRRVEKAGGVLFDSYTEAAQRADEENYPKGVKGLIPRVRGKFARSQIDGLRIYVPADN